MTTQTDSPYAQSVGETNGSSADPQGKALEAAGQAQEKAQALGQQAQDKLREALAARSSDAGDQINEQASGLRSAGQALREQGQDAPAKAADKLAEYAEKIGRYLSETDPDGMLHDAENFGRRQPAAFAAGGILLGFAASRFLKASSSRRRSAQGGGPQHGGQYPMPGEAVREWPADDQPAMQGTGVPAVAAPTPFTPPVPASDSALPGGVPPVDREI